MSYELTAADVNFAYVVTKGDLHGMHDGKILRCYLINLCAEVEELLWWALTRQENSCREEIYLYGYLHDSTDALIVFMLDLYETGFLKLMFP